MAPSTASTISNAALGPISLPLFKLSHCTISGPGARMLWTHLPNRDDMFAVFDEIRSRDLDGTVTGKQVMKLLRGGELLETIDFDSLKNQARMDRERAQSQSISDELLYVIMISKRPLLALRYRLPDGKIRRLQMNFQPPSGCDTALEILKPLGLPLRIKQESEQTRRSAQRPYSAQSILTISPPRSQDSRYTLGAPCGDVLSSVPLLGATPRSKPLENPDAFSKPISYIQDPRTQSQIKNDNNVTNYGRTSTERHIPLSTSSKSPDQALMMPPALRSLLPSPDLNSKMRYLNNHAARPVSAPEPNLASGLDETVPISQMLPPKRVLPFPEKPANRDVPSKTGSSKIQSLEQPTESHVPQPQPKKKRTAAKPRTKKAAVSKSKSDKSAPSNAPPNALIESRTPNQDASGEVPSSNAPFNKGSTLEVLEHTISKSSKDVTPPSSRGGTEASRKRPLSAIDDYELNKRQNQTSNKEPLPAPQSAAATQTANALLSNINPAEYLDSLESWIRKYQDLPAPGTAPAPPVVTAKDQLAEYASKSDEERAKMIDDMICECLQDENFGKLADDLEGHWKRICLGF